MSTPSTGSERVRPFLPVRDYDLSKRFYEALGFEIVLDGEAAIFNAGSGGFILQRYYQKEWAENTMLQLLVDDFNARWPTSKISTCRPSPQAPKPPALQRCSVGDSAGATLMIRARCSGMCAKVAIRKFRTRNAPRTRYDMRPPRVSRWN
ncbi:hypothetical protein [Lacipirellula sp.]|uniref:hypothetical protein n=1 Tax=Lacipirellula sp. TaxID=2691419 RepID=UPI003D0DDAF4